jgi:non-heme chloroperoxidase
MPHFHTRDGARLHYLDVGRGRPVVMLHAFGMRSAMWLPSVLPFAHNHRFVMLDFRGFGGSRRQRLSHGDVLRQNADDVHDLLEQLRLRDARLVGFSIGAATALEYQRQYGFDRFVRYLHVDQTPCIANKPDWHWGLMGQGNAQAFASARQMLDAFDGVDVERPFHALPLALRQTYWRWFGGFFGACFGMPWWRWGLQALGDRRAGGLLVRGDAWPVYLDAIRSFIERDYDFRDSLRKGRIPFWAILGRNSLIFPPEGQRRIAHYVPDTRIIEFRGCGHVIPAEAPARWVLGLRQYLAAET